MSCLKSFNFVTGFSIDYMHCVLLGVTKLLLKLWLQPSRNRDNLYSINRHVPELNERLKNVMVPSLIRRKPRSLDEIKHWKGIN